MIRSALLRVEAIEGLGRDLGSGLIVLALALSCAACGGSPAVLTAFRTEQQAQEHWRYRFDAALNLRSAPIGTTVSRGSALTPGLAVWLREASADVPAHVLPDRFATTPRMAVRKLFCK